MKKRILISVSNDLVTDQRVRKQCNSLQKAGYDVFLIGRALQSSLEITRPYRTHRMKLFFNKGALFYAELNIRLFLKLLFKRADYLWANDLDTLPANYFLSLFKFRPLIYDSHEFFTEVPEIQDRPLVKNTWKFFEKWMINRPSIRITVNQSIAELFRERYSIEAPLIVRNLPEKTTFAPTELSRADLLGTFTYALILQGNGINIDRGAEEIVIAMQYLDKTRLIILGSGDAIPNLKKLVNEMDLGERVIFFPRMPYEKMMAYSSLCDLGLSMDKPNNINYKFSLPNKVFDYAKAGLPVYASSLIEIERVFQEFPFGITTDTHDPRVIAEELTDLLENNAQRQEMKGWAKRASQELNWSKDFKKVLEKLNSSE